jgi:MFS transporter, putative metabolite:H+ symporter
LVIPGEMAARIDRLPMSAMAWEICLIVQIGWACAVSTDAIAARMYPFVWLPAKEITHSQYNVLYALEVGIGILIGGYSVGWLSDKVGRRPMLVVSSVLAGVFIWPFAYVTNYPALAVLSIGSTLGIGGYLAINVVYMSEIMGPTVRPRIMMVCQTVCIFLLLVILDGIIPHYWFPSQYKAYPWLLAGLNILVAVYLVFRMPESPRWLEARERPDAARKVVETMEARVSKGGRIPCPSPT